MNRRLDYSVFVRRKPRRGALLKIGKVTTGLRIVDWRFSTMFYVGGKVRKGYMVTARRVRKSTDNGRALKRALKKS